MGHMGSCGGNGKENGNYCTIIPYQAAPDLTMVPALGLGFSV